jgi:hypothetical protein
MLAALASTMFLACCDGPGSLHLTPPKPTGSAAARCAGLVAAAPARVDGQARRELSPASRFAAAWGDPAIVLRCGVGAPAALRRTSRCFVIDHVGWLVTRSGREVDPAQQVSGPLDFTTIGRMPYVAIQVPATYQPQADAVIDLTRAVKAHTTVRRPCS